MATFQDRYASALLRKGWRELESESRRYRKFEPPVHNYYWLGKSGAVRFGRTASQSIAVSAVIKVFILQDD